ncbi:unnamed protein product, partial [Brenthis ino]
MEEIGVRPYLLTNLCTIVSPPRHGWFSSVRLAIMTEIRFILVEHQGNPSKNALLLRQRRDVDFLANSSLLVEELIQNLRDSAKQALEAVNKFTSGINDLGKQFAEKIVDDIKNFRQRFNDAIKNITDRFTGAEQGVRNCIESHAKESDDVFVDIIDKSKLCADKRIEDVENLIESLKNLASNATDYISNVVTELKQCNENGQGIIIAGACFGRIAVTTELNGAVFATQSGFLIARIDLALATLPAALEICAGAGIVEAGVRTAKIYVDIGSCSVSSIYTSLIGNNESPTLSSV